MQIKKTKIKGLKIVTNKIYKDSRGHFKEDFKSKIFKKSFYFFMHFKIEKERSKRTTHANSKMDKENSFLL